VSTARQGGGFEGLEVEMTGYRSDVPENWFVDPVNLGVPGVRRPDADVDDNALAWQSDALCSQTDPEAFFPEKGGSTRDAKRICTSCDVRGECLEYALNNDERFGIWGGLSERERRKLKRRAG
jgi:WhiB family redox-sensing transcriptional regulator